MHTAFDHIFTNWCYQLEQGESTGRHHYQAQGRVGTKKRSGEVLNELVACLGERYRNFITIGPMSTNGEKTGAGVLYCLKVDTRKEGPWYDASFRAPKRAKRYEANDLTCMEAPLAWQAELIAQLKRPANDRQVVWIWNESGNAGKSKLIKYMCYKSTLPDSDWPTTCNVPLGTATQLKAIVCKNGAYDVFLCDIGRVSGNQESQRDLFSALECIKNGFVQNAMYGAGDTLFMEPPHVVIFSNDLPDVSLQSRDRWEIRRLDNRDSAMYTMSIAEVIELRIQQAEAKKKKKEDRERQQAEAEAAQHGGVEDITRDDNLEDEWF